MGFWCDLKIGRYSWLWRMYIPSEAVIIFIPEYKIHFNDNVDVEDERVECFFVSSVAKIKRNFDKMGLTNEFFLSIYATEREYFHDIALSVLKGRREGIEEMLLSNMDKKDDQKLQKFLQEVISSERIIKTSTASDEYKSTIELLKKYKNRIWKSYAEEEPPSVPIFNLETRRNHNDQLILKSSILGSFLKYAQEKLPEIAWLFEVRLKLESLQSNSLAKLDVSDWVLEGGEIEQLISDSIKELSKKANIYQKTFDAISGGNQTIHREISRKKIVENLNLLLENEITNYEKGKKLESLFECLIDVSSNLEIVQKNLRNETEELDLVVKNKINTSFWNSLNSPFIIVECKNWSSSVGVSEARIFESKMRQSINYCRIGFFVALNGVSKPFTKHIKNLKLEGISIAIITMKHINQLIESSEFNVEEWLEELITKEIFS